MLHSRMLRYIDEVARAGSIRQASLRLNVAASAINRQLVALEQELGGQLFERMPRGLRLTAMGEILIGHIRQTLTAYDQATNRIAQIKGLLRGKIVIGTMGGLASGVLADAIVAFREMHPWVNLTVRVYNRDTLVAAVLACEVDLGLAYGMEANPRLHVVARVEHKLGAVMAPFHPLAAQQTVRFADCLPYPLIVAEKMMSLRRITDLMVPATVDFRPAVETGSIDLMKRLARTEPNIAVLNYADVGFDLDGGSLAFRPFIERTAHQTITIFHRAAGSPEVAVSVMARELERAFSNSPPADLGA